MKKIYILPNLMTTGNFLCGVISIGCSLNGQFVKGALWILFSMIFDFLDGFLARISKASTKFGEEYDSLSDLMSFGAAPMVLMYQMSLSQMGRLGLSVAFIYCVCCALRLARYNARLDGRPKTIITGLPTPAAGGFIASGVIAADHFSASMGPWAPSSMLILALLMISTIRYPKPQVLSFMRTGHFFYLVSVAVVLGGIVLFGEMSLFVGFSIYVLGGLIYDLFWKDQFPEHLPETAVHDPKGLRP